MKLLNAAVAIALLVVFFVAGSIIIFGISSEKSLPFVYFVFVLVLLGAVILAIRKSLLPNLSDVVFAIVGAVVIAAAAALLVGIVTADSGSSAPLVIGRNSPSVTQSQLDQVALNDYYLRYVDYLNSEITRARANSQATQSEIDALSNAGSAASAVPAVSPESLVIIEETPAEQAVYDDGYYDEYEDDDRYEDEDRKFEDEREEEEDDDD